MSVLVFTVNGHYCLPEMDLDAAVERWRGGGMIECESPRTGTRAYVSQEYVVALVQVPDPLDIPGIGRVTSISDRMTGGDAA